MMRKLIHILPFITFAILVFGYPVWAMYYISSQSQEEFIPGSRLETKAFLPVNRWDVNLVAFMERIPVNPTPTPQSKSESSLAPALLLINKENGLSPAYEPPDLRVPRVPFSFTKELPHRKMAAEAASALEKLFARAKSDHIELVGVSGYRPYSYQRAVYRWNVRMVGKKTADRTSALPGHSEHQTGLAMDLSIPYLHFKLDERFGDTKAGHWIASHAAEYGFIIRYPKGKEEITGYQYEPWHIRYVGEEHARKIVTADVTLEEYLLKMK